MKKTYYRIQLFKGASSLCSTIAVLAAESNGGDKNVSLKQLKTVADGHILMYPILNEDTTAELIGDDLLHIDAKQRDGSYKTVCAIQQVELWETTNSELMENEEAVL